MIYDFLSEVRTVARYLSLVQCCMKAPRLISKASDMQGASIQPPLASLTYVMQMSNLRQITLTDIVTDITAVGKNTRSYNSTSICKVEMG